ncbi:MAG: hypothetical protein N2316_04485 [Spirochaetes bacterium]|nr:hypothetical protein [Spirochaetota bacterium]
MEQLSTSHMELTVFQNWCNRFRKLFYQLIAITALLHVFPFVCMLHAQQLFVAPRITIYPTNKVTDYAVVMKPLVIANNSRRLFALRKFTIVDKRFYLAVDIETLRTEIVPFNSTFENNKEYTNTIMPAEKHVSPYFAALEFCNRPPYRLHNHGIRGFSKNCKGAVLTMDLCPSPYLLDRSPFHFVSSIFPKKEYPIPIAIAVSGKWLANHLDDIHWLISLQKNKIFDITWINHSFTHPREYRENPKILSKGFLLTKGIDVEAEINKTEIAMIEAGITPSVFVRFPGLVADEKIIKKVCELGLIPIGSNAWLAKGEKVRNGSIILIHANGREKKGVQILHTVLSKKKQLISQGKWSLFDIHDCILKEFSQ